MLYFFGLIYISCVYHQQRVVYYYNGGGGGRPTSHGVRNSSRGANQRQRVFRSLSLSPEETVIRCTFALPLFLSPFVSDNTFVLFVSFYVSLALHLASSGAPSEKVISKRARTVP